MPFTIAGIDNEFAVSTGDNVGTSPNSSRFDNPPQGVKDLFVTTNEQDDDPRLFELGDTYDVTWGGNGGTSIEDAVVIRSDPAPDGSGSGIIVFEGIDTNGNVAQVIWTPGFDLEKWYADNYNPSAEPEFYTEDIDPNYDHRFVCFAAETRIKTPQGPKPASAFQAGDLVTTKDEGDVRVVWVGHRLCAATGGNAPVVFAQGAIGNTSPLRLSQQHRILLRSPYAQYYFGAEEVFLPAKACVNGDTVQIVQQARIYYVHLLLEKHHIVWAEGLECESLFLGDQALKALYNVPEFQALQHSAKGPTPPYQTARPVLKMKEAQLLMQHEHRAFAKRPIDHSSFEVAPVRQTI